MMKKLILISALLLFASNGWADEDVFGLDCSYSSGPEEHLLLPWIHNYFVLDMKNEEVLVWDTFYLVFKKNELNVSPASVSWGGGEIRRYYISRSTLRYRYGTKTSTGFDYSDWFECKMFSEEKIYDLADQHRKEVTKSNKF